MPDRLSDIEIAQQARMQRITVLAQDRLGIADAHLIPHGHHMAKIALDHVHALRDRPDGRLVLVTAMSPTPAGEGKTTAVVGLGDALNLLGRRAIVCLREPSMGPVFGMKGGAAGGGYAQVVPMEDINLHFTGDFAAIAMAHNLLAALLDNHIHHGNALGIDVRRITWKRVIDLNDRALRETVVGLGGPLNGMPRQDGFDIVVASEVMAVFCLAESLEDLRERLGNIVVAATHDQKPVHARDLQAHGAMTVLLAKAFAPNLVQTLENNPAIIHGGPFANIAHGCNSLIGTRTALKLADYVITEAGFGADLGAQKFFDIKCRKAGLRPSACVVVATVRALKYQGGAALADLKHEDVAALQRGIVNLERHVENLQQVYGMPCVVALNAFDSDTGAEAAAVRERLGALGVEVVQARHWAEGGKGALELAQAVAALCERSPCPPALRLAYEDSDTLWAKVEKIARRIYRAEGVTAGAAVRARIEKLQAEGHGALPVCIAKTPYSFSTDPKRLGAPTGHVLDIREVRLAAGAGFVVMICGDILTMPGLPKAPAAHGMDWVDGRVVGLS